MTSKERAKWRSEANSLSPIFQIGKNGLNDAAIASIDDALTARELIKVKVLIKVSPVSPKEAAEELCSATGAECVGVVGGVIILYRYSKELHDREKKKAANIRKAERDARHNAEARRKSHGQQNRNFRRDV